MFKLKFKTGNEAFQNDNSKEEIIRILKKVIRQIDNDLSGNKIMDINGNAIGEWEIT